MQLPLHTFEASGAGCLPARGGRIAVVPVARRLPPREGGDRAARRCVVDWARAHGRKLLFVDANHFLLELTARAFQGVGASCRTAGGHVDALRILEWDASVRAVILDYEIACRAPVDLADRARATRPGILLIGTSATNRRGEFARQGVDRFVPKPWCFEDLVHAASG